MAIRRHSPRLRTRAGLGVTLGVLLLMACEPLTVHRVNDQRAAADRPALTTSVLLTERARARAAQLCASGTVGTDPAALVSYLGEPTRALAELVGSAPLDATLGSPAAQNLAAGDELWETWRTDPRLLEARWDAIGVGEHTCDTDGRLYSALVLRDDAPRLDAPAVTDRIVVADGTTTADGWVWQRYRNLAAPCSIGGVHSFVVGTRAGSDPAAPAPLWVRMRGGGAGWFAPDGSPQPSAANKSEESLSTQMGFNDGGLLKRARAEITPLRVLIVSMCSHDIYGGNDSFDPYNPNTTSDGHARTTGGLAATKAAVAFTRALYPTTGMVLHGTSAGGYGVYHVAWALQRMGIPPMAVVSDSGVLNQAWLRYVAGVGIPGSSGCEKNTEQRGLGVQARIDPEVVDPANEPHRLVADGRLTVPVMHVYSRGDHALCGSVPIPCPLPDGSTPTLWAAECMHEPMRLAVASLGPGHPSRVLRLCVEGSRPEPCDRHVPTRNDVLNTDPDAPADFNGAILAWVRERLGPG